MGKYVLAIDQGTTSSRAILFATNGEAIAIGRHPYEQHYPADGWVEHEPDDIWRTTLRSCQDAISRAGIDVADVASIGITNQRETTILWHRKTGKAVHRAIVWQDRRTASYCDSLQRQLTAEGKPGLIQEKTGLLPDPYFSASKLAWLLKNVPGAREEAEAGNLAFGTVDCFLLWQLTGGKVHATDASNASRTMLFNIHTQRWDDDLLALFDIPTSVLPDVKNSADDFGHTDARLLGRKIPISAMIGDQQSATVGQGCLTSGMTKSTYGTGSFLLMNTGEKAIQSDHRLLTTVAYRLTGKTTYALEGSIFMAGATMQWLRDKLRLFDDTAQSEALARQAQPGLPVMMVPAFTGLGAPWWDADARAAIYGLTRDAGIPELVAAALMSVCFQTKDLQKAMESDGLRPTTLRVDGGMSANNLMLQNLADLLGCEVSRPKITETTALGAAFLAGLHCGLFSDLTDIESLWQQDRSFTPAKEKEWRNHQYERWLDAVARTRSQHGQ